MRKLLTISMTAVAAMLLAASAAAQAPKLTLNDLFRKREKPQFHYVSRFDDEGNLIENPSELKSENITAHKIRHRFDNDDMDRLKPVPAGKIIIYTLAVCILLIFIFS